MGKTIEKIQGIAERMKGSILDIFCYKITGEIIIQVDRQPDGSYVKSASHTGDQNLPIESYLDTIRKLQDAGVRNLDENPQFNHFKTRHSHVLYKVKPVSQWGR